ncbi:GGDEF domain-containing protein [Chitinimonas lacunae]|uniref:diguanylate cyclase n=1 Tax=Chitinimonas lacunae TaxID=1963018 RepID=A0ABV8MRN3_9NEIS
MSSSPTLTPTDIARIALKRLAELGLPPTPDNYGRFYNAVATIKTPQDKTDVELRNAYAILFQIAEVVDEVSETADQLLLGLDLGSRHIHDSLLILRSGPAASGLEQLVNSLIGSTDQVYRTVSASQRDLQELRDAIERIQSDLDVNRQTMERDPLTGALNRQGMEQLLNREVKRSHRTATSLCLAMIDLDDFKQVNDRWGHLVGDHVLIHFVRVAKAVLRETDLLVRYGGEEFLLLLPDTDLNGAHFLIDRLRQVNLRTPFHHDDQTIEVRFSTGLAQLRPDENGHGLLVRADAAMYQAKMNGRDQVVLAN